MPSVYEVAGQPGPINWSPSDEATEVLQNVRFILGTIAGTVPLARSLGISGAVIDAPMTKAKSLLMTSVYRGIRRNEPRADVAEIYVDDVDGTTGQIVPRVKIKL